ncbi:MAG: methyltransferase [Pseudomonadota bacterium]
MKVMFNSLFLAAVITHGVAVAEESPGDLATLQAVVEARSVEDRARDGARHPVETLSFFQVEPGMTVAEGLPGGGWYTRILAPYLGEGGTLLGVTYADRMWSMFSFATPEWIAGRKEGAAKFPEMVASITDVGPKAMGFTFESMPADVQGTVDRVLLIRALHNLNRFDAAAQTRSNALKTVHAMLRDNGLVGVVQHRAPESATDAGATGSRGYLKQSAVIQMFNTAGFELVASSEINANPKDQPTEADIVWRLPPSLRGSEDDPKLRASLEAVGESDRMTLLFRKAPDASQQAQAAPG